MEIANGVIYEGERVMGVMSDDRLTVYSNSGDLSIILLYSHGINTHYIHMLGKYCRFNDSDLLTKCMDELFPLTESGYKSYSKEFMVMRLIGSLLDHKVEMIRSYAEIN